ncbi:hypothetical protein Dda_4805 [Drechslerella dactyloides]|uniref:Peptidase S1 domain-containing protein n=1 Tax=Drechslerella dactyloides TaxID=74499 RepID=A0AAD6IXL2_DREDA|nr:hypothetical protein Dda_4805 [Drechslerella dactyloides]
MPRSLPEGEISQWEAQYYYRGVPSHPRLVYRTDTVPLPRPAGLAGWPFIVEREVFPVHGHAINKIWDEIGPKIWQALDDHEVRWTSLDLVKFKITGNNCDTPINKISPVIIWVGVAPATLSADKARSASETCLQLLEMAGITDVEMEYRESRYIRTGGARLRAPDRGETRDRRSSFSAPLSVTLGLSIAARDNHYVEGTGGLYIAEGGDGKNVYLLTARHVVISTDLPNDTFEADRSVRPCEAMLLGPETYKKLKSDTQRMIQIYKMMISNLQEQVEQERAERKAAGEETGVGHLEKRQQEDQGQLQWYEELYEELRTDWQADQHNDRVRKIGHIDYSPPIAYGDEPGTYTTDYALIALDQEKFRDNFSGNLLDLGDTQLFDILTMMMPHLDSPVAFDLQHLFDGYLQLSGIMSEEEIKNPPPRKQEGDDISYHIVMKNGKTTGLTFGRAGASCSFCRQYLVNGTTQTSKEWPIYAYEKKVHNRNSFSEGGDSGSVVVDGRGRVAGLLTAGCGWSGYIYSDYRADYFDISYATPFFWIFDHIRKNRLPNANLNPTMD